MEKTPRIQRVRRIVTHYRPHFDELLAIRLLKRHGGKFYPGIENAEIVYNTDGESPQGLSWEEHFDAGTLLVGVGGGPFDEHPTSQGEERKKKESACSLVAKHLGLEKHPVYKRIVQGVTQADQEGVDAMHAANLLKEIYRHDTQEKGIDFGLYVLDIEERKQKLFLAAQRYLQSLVDSDQHIKIYGNDQDLDLVVVKSDNYKMSAAARSLKIAILIQQQPTGHVQIFTNTDAFSFNMKFVVAEIRKAEMKADGMSKAKIEEIPDLDCEGKIPEVLNWFYQVPGNNLLNSSETAPDTRSTKLSLDKIVKIVQTSVYIESAAA